MTETVKNENMAYFLKQAKISNKLPNFWMSEEYAEKARLKVVDSGLFAFMAGFTGESSLIESDKNKFFHYLFLPNDQLVA